MNRLKKLRLKRGLTLRELSGCLNDEGVYIAPDTLAKYERGDRNPKIEKWLKLADFYGVSVPYLKGRYDHLTKKEALQTIHEIMTICGISKGELKDRL